MKITQIFVFKFYKNSTKVACGWAGAVMEKAYSSIGAEAVMQKAPKNAKKVNADPQTDGQTD